MNIMISESSSQLSNNFSFAHFSFSAAANRQITTKQRRVILSQMHEKNNAKVAAASN